MATGKALWSKSFPKDHYEANLTCSGDQLYLAVGGWHVIACDAGTGKELWRVPLAGDAGAMAAAQDLVFCEVKDGVLAALDSKTGRQRWVRDLRPHPVLKGADAEVRLTAGPLGSGGRLYVGTSAGTVFCLEPTSGAVRWRFEAKDSGDGVTGVTKGSQRLYVAVGGKVAALNIVSGEQLWITAEDLGAHEAPILLGDVLVFVGSEGVLYGLDALTGSQRWEQPIPGQYPVMTSPVAAYAGRAFVMADSTLVAFDDAGTPLWQWDSRRDPGLSPCATILPDGVVLSDESKFARYVMGEPPKPPANPTQRRALARKLVARLETLDEDEKRLLEELGDDAFVVLLPIVKERMAAYQRAAAQRQKGPGAARALASAKAKFGRGIDALREVTTKQGTAELLALLRAANRIDTQDPILGILAYRGDDRQTMPVFIAFASKAHHGPVSDGRLYTALSGLTASRDPRAIKFLIDELANPNADSSIRRQAFMHLPVIGGDDGLRAVLAARDTRRTLPPLAESLGLSQLGTAPKAKPSGFDWRWVWETQLLATRRNENGVLWGLIRSRALGAGDLWIARHDGKRWIAPVFTGADEDDPRRAGWFSKFVGNPELAKDTDGDGWTDLIEARLGTDPNNPDTDSDGLNDFVDKNPLAAPRQLDDAEQVLAAAFAAEYQFSPEKGMPCLIELPKGMKPFEFYGWGWITVARQADARSPLAEVAGTGLAVTLFSRPQADFEDRPLRRPASEDVILWNANHTEAKVQVTRWFSSMLASGTELHLRKFGDHWLVIGQGGFWIT